MPHLGEAEVLKPPNIEHKPIGEGEGIFRPRNDWPSYVPMERLLGPVEESPSFTRDTPGFMACALARAKWWLPLQVDNLVLTFETWDLSTGYLNLIRKVTDSPSAILDCEEMVRRCEQAVEQAVAKAQDEGRLRSRKYQKGPTMDAVLGTRGKSLLANLHRDYGSIDMGDFETGIELARETGSLSRMSLLRAIQGQVLEPTRSEWHRGKRRLDSNKLLESLAEQMESAITGIDLIDPVELDQEKAAEAVESIRGSIKTIQKEIRKWL